MNRNTQRLVGWALWHLHAVQKVAQARTLVPRHVGTDAVQVVAVETGDRDELNVLRLEAGLLGEDCEFADDFLLPLFLVLASVHLVDCADHLADTKSVRQESVFSGLTFAGKSSLETSHICRENHQSNVSL